MASSPRLLLSRCSCTCGQATALKPSSSTSARSIIQAGPSSRAASTSAGLSHRLKPPQRWVVPDFASRKRAVNLPAPRAQKFENKITLPDGSASSVYTTSPRSNIAITKDTSNHPLWAFPSAAGTTGPQEDEGGRMGRFARRFGGGSNERSINQEQERVIQKVDQAVSPAGNTEMGAAAAEKVAKTKTVEEKKEAKSTPKVEETAGDALELFDLSLEGEEVEVTGHKVVEEAGGKKGKKGAAKKK